MHIKDNKETITHEEWMRKNATRQIIAKRIQSNNKLPVLKWIKTNKYLIEKQRVSLYVNIE